MPSQYHLNTDHWSKMRMNVSSKSLNILPEMLCEI